MNEKQSECDNSVILEDLVIKDENNTSVSEMAGSDLIDKMEENLKNSDKDYSEIVVDVLG